MDIINTLETGIRVSKVEELMHAFELISNYSINHIQIVGASIDQIFINLEKARNNIGPSKELSLYVSQGNNWETLLNPPARIFEICRKHDVKYLIFSISSSLMTNKLQNLIELGEKNHIFLCLEVNPDKIKIDTLDDLKNKYSSPFFLFTFDYNDIGSTIDTSQYRKYLQYLIGIITLKLNVKYLHQRDRYFFISFLRALFTIPYKQRPLIFTNALNEIPIIYKEFYEIIEEYNLVYI